MQFDKPTVFIGWDSREPIAYKVCEHSINRRTKAPVLIYPLKHRDLRQKGWFRRPWLVESDTGNWRDLIDNRPFSTEFSHTRFLIPAIMNYQGWALFMDSDMIFTSDIAKLWALRDNKYAAMCVKHNHKPVDKMKMDGRQQYAYFRKNWSSFMLFNCAHPANKALTIEMVNMMPGGELHALSWLKPHEIGDLPKSYNWISGASPSTIVPDVIHYTDGGPWFNNEKCRNVPMAEKWSNEYEHWQEFGNHDDAEVTDVPSVKYEVHQ